jgi:hypothetical protein
MKEDGYFMRINLQVHLNVEDQKLAQSGSFVVRKESDIPKIAHDWIRKIKRETSYRDTYIEKVLVNSEKDITEEVRKIDEAPIPEMDNL